MLYDSKQSPVSMSSNQLSKEDSLLLIEVRYQITQHNYFLSKYEFICIGLRYIGLSPGCIGFTEAALAITCILLIYPESSFPSLSTQVYPIVAALQPEKVKTPKSIGKNIDDAIRNAWQNSKEMKSRFYRCPNVKRFLKYFVDKICLGGKISKNPQL